MNKEKLDEICKAKMILCSRCQSDMCEWCRVEHLVNEAKMTYESGEDDELYVRSSTNGDYSPSNPWDAPGMSVSDFI